MKAKIGEMKWMVRFRVRESEGAGKGGGGVNSDWVTNGANGGV